LKYIAVLEREADEARFDWIEFRATADASKLWSIFAHKAAALDRALAARRISRLELSRGLRGDLDPVHRGPGRIHHNRLDPIAR
jgi:hypothetical protein